MNLPKQIEHFAKIRREVVLHRMVTSECVDDRLFWGIILWSWAGPERSIGGAVVLKDKRGFIRTDNHGQSIPAKLKDLRELMGWPETSKALVTRIVKRLIEKNSITFDKKTGTLYAVEEPSLPEIPKVVAGTGNWYIGREVVGTGNLPTDPEARYRAIQWLEKASTQWKNDLKSLRTRYRDMLVQAAPELGILYVLEEKKSRGEEAAAAVVEEPAAAGPPSLPPAPIESYVAEELSIDEDAAERLVAGCKEVEPSVTGPEIVELARSKLVALRGQKILNPVGLLIKHVPRTCKGGTLRAIREQIETQKKERAQRVAYAREAWDGLNEVERAEVLVKYPELAKSGVP
jgi:hypothetical protein